MRKPFVFMLVCSFLCLFTAGGALAQGSKEPYKIGAVMSLTGYSSWVGVLSQKGAQVQAEMINKAGGVNGRPLELIIYDAQSKPEESSRVTQRLITRDKVVALTGAESVPVAAPMVALANQNKTVVVMGGGYPVNPEKEPYIFNFSHPTDFAIQRPFLYFKKHNMTKLAFIMPIGSLGELATKLGKQYAAEYGLTIVGEEKFEGTVPDVTAQLAKLRALKPDAYVAFASGEPAAMVARNAAQLNIKEPILVSHGNATLGFLKMVSNLSTFLVLPSGKVSIYEQLPDSDPAKKVLAQFDRRMRERFNEPGTYYSGQQADGIALIAEGLRKAGTSDEAKLRDAVENIKGLIGTNGIFNMTPKDHYGLKLDDMVVITVKGGKWVLLD